MYYLVLDSGVYAASQLKELNKKFDMFIEEDELTVVGNDKFKILTDKDMDFLQDKRKMSRIFFGNFFRSDTKPIKIIQIVSLVVLIILLLLLFSVSKNIDGLINALTIAANGG